MPRMPLPPPLPLSAPLRQVRAERAAITELPHHRLRITIDHEPLCAVTTEMLLWWFRHIGDDIEYLGEIVPRYRAWHPLDHIHWELAREAPGGGANEGARFRIVEAMGRDQRFYVDTVDRVEKLDATGIRLVLRIAGAQFFQLEHTWSRAENATHYTSVMDIGSRSPLAGPMNRYVRRRAFAPGMAEAWVKHNVEEVGILQEILPSLFLKNQLGIGPV
ncbi:MAG: hypothetical protein ABWY57_12945 [Mycetocola sp.]